MSSKWESVALGDLMAKRSDFTVVDSDAKYEVVGVQRSGWGLVRREPIRGDSMQFSRLMRLEVGDLVYRTITAFEAPSAVVDAEFVGSFVTPQTFPVFRLDSSRILPSFMSLQTTYPEFHKAMSDRCTGTVLRRKTLSVAAFRAIPIALPPIEEQRRIVDLMRALDDDVEIRTEELARLKTLFTSTLENLVGGIPGADDAVPLGQQFRVIDCEHKTAPAGTDAFARSVGTSDIRGGRFLLESAKPVSESTYLEWTSRAEPAPGDVVLTREAPVGQVALVTQTTGRICLGQRTVLLRPTGAVTGAYLWAALLSASYQRFLQERSIGQTVQRVNVKLIKELPIRIPDLLHSAKVNETAFAFTNVIEAQQSTLRSLQALRLEALSALLSGAHRIPETYDELMGA